MTIFINKDDKGVLDISTTPPKRKNQVEVSREDRVKLVETYFGKIYGLDKVMVGDDFHWGLQWVFTKRVSELLSTYKESKVTDIRGEFEELECTRMVCGMDYSSLKNSKEPLSKNDRERLIETSSSYYEEEVF
mgnify:CR=1 FL=1|tara:strand:+ start:86 stop:484 length:399 start_codon:yes stop_codon:yes gene_type:complete